MAGWKKIATINGLQDASTTLNLDSLIIGSASTSASSITLTDTGNGTITFEGATADTDKELTLTCEDPTDLHTITFPDDTGTVALTDTSVRQNFDGDIRASRLLIGAPAGARSIAIDNTNQGEIKWEGNDIDAYKTILNVIEPTAAGSDINTIALPDASGTVMLNLLDDASPELGGDLDLNGQNIVGAGDILLTPALETATQITATYNQSGARKFRIDCTNDNLSGDGFLELLSDAGVYNHLNNARSIVKDEDAMSSNSNKHLATQQSIKAYVDDSIETENRYEFEYKVCNYASSTSAISYLPLAGYLIEQTSLSALNSEYVSMVMPHDGTFHNFLWRATGTQNTGNKMLVMYRGVGGDAYASTEEYRTRITSTSIIANYTYENEIGVTSSADLGLGDNTFSKGDIISIGFDPSGAPGDVKCTVVFKYDMTT